MADETHADAEQPTQDMTPGKIRENANAMLEFIQDAVKNRNPYAPVLAVAPIPEGELDCAGRVEQLQEMQTACLELLSQINHLIGETQLYQTSVLNPEGLGENPQDPYRKDAGDTPKSNA